MTSRNSDARGKALESGENSRAKSNPNALEILSSWEGRGKLRQESIPSPNTPAPSSEVNSVDETDEAALAVCFDKQGLARFLGLSVRSLDRANAMGLLPCPDLVCGRSPRWSPSTIEKWLRTRPRLPGRGSQ
jgi:predicted DNA-binding transcriptional regulator AlpA